uniref:hypothetical protein n=1 Tax=uncultured Pseudomonas sp. TaxID=114707 RepID=UPI00258D5A6A
ELRVRSMMIILPLMAALDSDLTDANDPPLLSITVDTVAGKEGEPVNCVMLLLHSKVAKLYWCALIWCIFR